MPEGKTKITYCYAKKAAFVVKDIELLREVYEVREYQFVLKKKWKIPFLMIGQAFASSRLVFSRSVVISRLSGAHTFIPSLFAKLFSRRLKHIIILGGAEANKLPFINYGLSNRKWISFLNRISLKYASHLAPVSRHLISSEYTFDDRVPSKQGINAIYPDVQTNYTEVFNGFDSVKFNLTHIDRKKYSFVTIADDLHEERRRLLKGIDMILDVAERMPDFSFTIIGSKEVGRNVPNNVNVVPFVPNAELASYLNKFEYYFQLSLSEGFPNALCEAMLCGCIPIVSKVGIMPEIISDTGHVLNTNDLELLIALLKEMPARTESESTRARQRIIDNYSLTHRKQKLIEIIDDQLAKIGTKTF